MVITMLNVMELAKQELENKVSDVVCLIESKITESLKCRGPKTITITEHEIGVHNQKMFTRIYEKVSEHCPDGISLSLEKSEASEYLKMNVKVDYKNLF